MSFQDSVIKEIADMTTTKSQLWKFEIVYPLTFKGDSNDEYSFCTKVVQTTIILDYETFKKGYGLCLSQVEHEWNDLTTGNKNIRRFNSKLFDTIHEHIEEASDREGINLEDAYVTILSRTLLN